MNTLVITLCAVVVVASASSIGIVGIVNPAAHIPSGSIGVSKDGAVVAGPAGSVRTDNGLYGQGAGAQLSGPAGDVRTRGGSTVVWNAGGLGGLRKGW